MCRMLQSIQLNQHKYTSRTLNLIYLYTANFTKSIMIHSPPFIEFLTFCMSLQLLGIHITDRFEMKTIYFLLHVIFHHK